MKHIIFALLMASLSVTAFAQDVVVAPKERKLTFGFGLGVNYSSLSFQSPDVNYYTSSVSNNGYGFRLGLLADWKMGKRLSFSPKAEMAFYESRLLLLGPKSDGTVYQSYPLVFEIAGHFNYRLFNLPVQPYLILGPSVKLPFADGRSRYTTYRPGYAMDIGLGLNKKFKMFTLAPELRYSFGLSNASNIPFVSNVRMHTVALVCNFKG